MRYSVREVKGFRSFVELENCYYGSQYFEVRGGIISDLLHGLSHDGKLFPLEWRVKFLLLACEEFALEANASYKKKEEISHLEPVLESGTTHCERMHRIDEYNELFRRGLWCSKIAAQCFLFPLDVYVSERKGLYRGKETEIDKGAEKLLDLMASRECGPYMDMDTEPRKGKIGEFLEVYERHQEHSLPGKWFQSTMRSSNLYLLLKQPWERVREQLKKYLIMSVTEEVQIKITLSTFKHDEVAKFFVSELHRRGELDSLVDFGM